ncbi:uncharacterized protein A4U43_C09F13970 [Asparagus officinalis]|uniref:adenylate kinase n=1 Tax=Asparagus officinalis TaxID=4686 RepID=A0A5P1EAH5_ASPOF|nr:uncharacterized protein A4U43_C09F13970 [Asparagus officinalis]
MAVLNRLIRSAVAARSPALTFSSLSSSIKDPSFPATTGRTAAAERNVQWVFLGCPGVGKGTYASRLSSLLGVPHIATGDLVREELNSSGPLSKQAYDAMLTMLISKVILGMEVNQIIKV